MVTSNTARAGGKSSSAFRTISEVSQELEVPQHVLRFWETKFSSVRPLKRGGGRRYYRPEDISLLRHIRDLLYAEGYTIRGVQKVLRDNQGKLPEEEPQEKTGNKEEILRDLVTELTELRDMLLKASKTKS